MAKKKQSPQTKRIQNKRARHDYELGDSLVVGIELTGRETKALRMGHGTLRGAYVTLRNGELWLVNAQITSLPGVIITAEEQTRSRKLLAKRSEIDKLAATKDQGNTIVPIEMMTGGKYIKLRIASGRGKRQYDKRQAIKKRDQEREVLRKL